MPKVLSTALGPRLVNDVLTLTEILPDFPVVCNVTDDVMPLKIKGRSGGVTQTDSTIFFPKEPERFSLPKTEQFLSE